MRGALQAIFAMRPSDKWVERLRVESVPVAKINDFAGVIADPQVQHCGMVVQVAFDGVPTRPIDNGQPVD